MDPDYLLECEKKIIHMINCMMELIKDRVSYDCWPPHLQIAEIRDNSNELESIRHDQKELVDVAISAHGKLKFILEDDIFHNLYEHHPYWISDHYVESEKLDDLRVKLLCLNDNLWEVCTLLNKKFVE